MKKRLLAALVAALLLLTSCGYIVVDDDEETILSSVLGVAHAEEAVHTDIEIQQRLKELGFLTGKADGIFGPRSVQALTDFQTFCGLEATGEKDEATLGMLFGDPAALPTPSPTPIANGAQDAEGVTHIQDIQAKLIELNYLSGKADGIFGKGTENALMSFQELNGLEITGIADEDTIEALNATAAIPMPTPEPTPRVKGARGDEIKLIQEALRIMGFMSGSADGDFGPATEEAVKRYQQYVYDEEQAYYEANPTPSPTPSPTPTIEPTVEPTSTPRVTSTPKVTAASKVTATPKTTSTAKATVTPRATAVITLITAKPTVKTTEEPEITVKPEVTVEPAATEAASEDITEATIEPTAEPTVEPTPEPTPWTPDGVVTDELMDDILSYNHVILYREDMQRGSSGSEVVRMQRRLASLWYLSSSGIDGQYGPNTESAIKYFQKRNKLEQTGIADEETQLLLFSAEAIKSDRPYHMYKIKVSVKDQRVYVYKWVNGDYSELVRTMVCSTGTYESPTPLGTFSSGGCLGRWYYFKKFDCWAQYAYQITGPYYFHSVIYSEKDESTLRKGSVNALGSRASHGCIRLKVEDAKWIYNNCPAGTTVVVY